MIRLLFGQEVAQQLQSFNWKHFHHSTKNTTGFISKRNISTLTTLHSFMRKDLKKSKFLSNLNALAWNGSYKIWLTRDDPNFADPPFLISHI